MSAERYHVDDSVQVALSKDTHLVYSRRTGGAHVLPASLSQVLARGRSLALPPEPAGAAADLDALRRAGLVCDESEVIAALASAMPPPPSPIAWLGVVTSGRPAALRRGLTSYVENARRFGRTMRVAVADDSRTESERAANVDVLNDVARGYGIPTSYAGADEKTRFAAELARECDASEDLLRFAFFDPEGFGATYGANRNALLLQTLGGGLLSVDDDTIAQTGFAGPERAGLALDCRLDRRPVVFYESEEAALAAVRWGEHDLVGAHERLLGAQVADGIARFADEGPVALEHAGAPLLRRAMSRRARVAMTTSGLVGDSGMGHAGPLLLAEGPSFESLLRSPEAYGWAAASRQVVMASPQTTISSCPITMTTSVGLDNSSLLPPFLPVTRGEDALFAFMLQKSTPEAHFGYLPVVVRHAPVERRRAFTEGLWRTSGRPLSLTIAAFMTPKSAVPAGGGTAGWMRDAGQRLLDLAALPRPDFVEALRVQFWDELSGRIRLAELRLERRSHAPEYWVADLRRHIEHLRAQMLDPEAAFPADLRRSADGGETADRARRLFHRFGELTRTWPTLVEAARALARRGVHLGERR
jgi:hypothetical protein